MTNKKFVGIMVLAIFTLFCFILVAGCGGSDTSIKTGDLKNIGLPPSVDPMEYFPMKIGTQWQYKVKVENNDPLTYKVMHWPVGNGERSYSVRGLLTTKDKPKEFALTLKATGIVSKEGPFNYSEGVAIQTAKDGLNIFRDNTGMFWVVLQSSEGAPMVTQIVTYSTDIPGGSPWGAWGVGEAYSQGIIFFADQPMIQMSIAGDHDQLLFLGVDTNVPGYEGYTCLHFQRNVDARDTTSSSASDYMDQAFSEDTWFAKGKGLVRLEQNVGGQRSMTWTMENFSSG